MVEREEGLPEWAEDCGVQLMHLDALEVNLCHERLHLVGLACGFAVRCAARRRRETATSSCWAGVRNLAVTLTRLAELARNTPEGCVFLDQVSSVWSASTGWS